MAIIAIIKAIHLLINKSTKNIEITLINNGTTFHSKLSDNLSKDLANRFTFWTKDPVKLLEKKEYE